MKLIICGVRGSAPAPGAEFLAHGGNTSCLAIAGDDGRPRLLLDAGTGITRVTGLLGGAAFQGSILLGHLHWDHTQGLPFFTAADRPDSRVELYLPAQGEPREVLTRAMSPPHFPITPDELRGAWSFRSLEEGDHRMEGFAVRAREIPHKGGRSFGYRISDGRASFAYLSDHCPTSLGPGPYGRGVVHPAAVELAEGVDVLFHDAQYTDEELPERAYFGHSSPGYAVDLAVAAGAGRVVLFHHDPRRTDEEVDGIVARYSSAPVPVEAAREGVVMDL
jgi:ribonuclease BN (tRNA processing enzyme)